MASTSLTDDTDDSINMNNPLPSKVIVTVGTYDGVLAGWELKSVAADDSTKNGKKKHHLTTNTKKKLEISFATPVHGGSVRSLSLAAAAPSTAGGSTTTPGSLLSSGYDEMLRTHDWHKRMTCSGEVRTPADMGTPVCSSFAPPCPSFDATSSSTVPQVHSTHCLVGFSSGKVIIYKKRNWELQHVLAGHTGGVASLAVHPSGKLALTGGETDGKLKVWDLTKGRLSFVHKLTPLPHATQGRARAAALDPITSMVWSRDGSFYAYCHGSQLNVRQVATGQDWCRVELPSRINQICLLQGPEGLFVAAACNDGSLPVLAVQTVLDDTDRQKAPDPDQVRRAVMAIEPVEGPVAGEERYKCIHTVCGYYVVTANSAGVVSLMNLAGAIRMIMTGDDKDENPDGGEADHADSENPANDDDDDDNNKDSDSDSSASSKDSGGEEEMAVDIIDAVQLGSGARVTCLVAWACDEVDVDENDDDDDSDDGSNEENQEEEEEIDLPPGDSPTNNSSNDKKRKSRQEMEMDPKDVEKARALVSKAKKLQKRKDSKRRKLTPGE